MRAAKSCKALLLAGAAVILAFPAFGQRPRDAKSPDEVLGISDAKKSQVLLLGVWHFNYPGLDDHKIDPSDQVDILSDDRQKELGEILDTLAHFRPAKICLEWVSQETLNQSYRDFLEGTSKPNRSETYQIGFRLAKHLGHKEVYAVDAKAWGQQVPNDPEIKRMWDSVSKNSSQPGAMGQAYKRWFDYTAQYAKTHPLRDALLLYNDADVLDRALGVYLVDSFRNPNQ